MLEEASKDVHRKNAEDNHNNTYLIPRHEHRKYGHRNFPNYRVSRYCHPRNCKACHGYPHVACFCSFLKPLSDDIMGNASGWCKYRFKEQECKRSVAVIMNKIYDSNQSNNQLFIVGKLHEMVDWRRFVLVQKCDKGFHYLLV